MIATPEQLKKWNELAKAVSVQQVVRATKLHTSTINNVLNGHKVRLCNFIKVHKYFTSLDRKVKRLKSNDVD